MKRDNPLGNTRVFAYNISTEHVFHIIKSILLLNGQLQEHMSQAH